MEILFRQSPSDGFLQKGLLEALGIERALFKYIPPKKDRTYITRKRHYHTSVEIHVIQNGFQAYEIDSNKLQVQAGQFLLIAPQIPHVAAGEDTTVEKYAFTFCLPHSPPFTDRLSAQKYFLGSIPEEVNRLICKIQLERARKEAFHVHLVGNLVGECILYFLRAVGFESTPDEQGNTSGGDERVLLARQYIEDNIRQMISVAELASYCCIGEKQMERLFKKEVGMTVMELFRQQKCREIEKMLSDPQWTLKEISEAMSFQNEYYFNTFFKKYAGMTPGAYRKSVCR